ncbi:MAG: hypothetical protein CMK09_09245 [Ponticaulis sp.]|nr:hypothetical protein [Ponticaulis sp.]|tara:strand:- start:13773 stop:14594 length:822 start_codon:yes stop_codon:yes gene_type:complete
MLELLFPCVALVLQSDLPLAHFPVTPPAPAEFASPCERQKHDGASLTVCSFDRDDPGLRLFLNDESGAPYGEFDAINSALAEQDKTLIFAMNAGMYHEDRSPVGLYMENGEELAPLQTGEGYGNFHLLPNGVFVIWQEDGLKGTHVLETNAYQSRMAHDVVNYATQSGPMLVIDNELHPKFNPESTSFKRRNGVGIDEDFNRLYFVLSDGWVTFHAFASFFRDELGCENALYLDGSISRLYDKANDRSDIGPAMGPVVGVVRPSSLSDSVDSD